MTQANGGGPDLFEHFITTVQGMVEEAGTQVPNGEDWPPAVCTASEEVLADGRMPLLVAALPPDSFASEESKNFVAEAVIPIIVRATEANMAAFLSTAWMVVERLDEGQRSERAAAVQGFIDTHGHAPTTYTELKEIGVDPPSESADRVEAVTIMARTKEGRSCLASGRIERPPEGSPRIERWDDVFIAAKDENTVPGGRFADALKVALSDQPLGIDPTIERMVRRSIRGLHKSANVHKNWR